MCKVKWALGSITTNKASGGDGISAELFEILKDDAIYQQIWKTQQWPEDWKRSIFIPIPKKGNAKECSNYHTVEFISHASKIMLKILQASLQQYMNQELPDVQAGFQRGRGTRVQIVTICWTMEKTRDSRKASTSASLTMLKPLTIWSTTKWNILKERGILGHLTCLLRNFYAGQEATVRTEHGITDWKKNTSRLYTFTLLI